MIFRLAGGLKLWFLCFGLIFFVLCSARLLILTVRLLWLEVAKVDLTQKTLPDLLETWLNRMLVKLRY